MSEEQKQFTPIESQEDLDAIVRARLARERERYADYEEIKKKAAEHDKRIEAEKSEAQKAREEAERLRADLAARDAAARTAELRAKVAKATGVPADLITGSDEESMTEIARQIAEYAKRPAAPKVPESGSFAESDKTGDDAEREFVRALTGRNQ